MGQDYITHGDFCIMKCSCNGVLKIIVNNVDKVCNMIYNSSRLKIQCMLNQSMVKGLYMDKIKMVKEMGDYGFDYDVNVNDDLFMKNYKCYLSKKCNDEKYSRIKKMFDYVKNDEKFVVYMGMDYKKLCESFINDSRGEGVKKIDFDGMDIMNVFSEYKLGVKEVLKKGYDVKMIDGKEVYVKK